MELKADEHSAEAPLPVGPETVIDDRLFTKMTEVFALFDKHQDGAIGLTEVGAMLRSIGFNPSEKQIREIQTKYGQDGNEIFTFSMFKEMVSSFRKEGDTETEILEAFRLFDPHRTGNISASDLRLTLMTRGEPLTEVEVDRLIAFADVDRRGEIRYIEFARKLLKEY